MPKMPIKTSKMKICYYSTVHPKQVDWLWYPYIPYGKITVIQGDPGDGKTTVALSIASILSNGHAAPGSEQKLVPGNILYQSAEDSIEDTIKPRLIKIGADCSKIAFIDESLVRLSLNSPLLESAIKKTNAKLLILDPLQAYLGGNNDLHRANNMRPLMRSLSKTAERTGCAVVIIGHMNKTSSAKGLYRGLGSIDITAAARSVLLVGRVPSEPSIRIMAHIKNSLAQEGPSMAFEINDTAGIRWIGKYDIREEDLLGTGDDLPDERKRDTAAEIILKMLRTGPRLCSDIYSECLREGIRSRTVDTAKKILGVRSVRKPDGWYWVLPDEDDK